MNILGIETATNVLGVALTEDRRLIAEIRLNFKKAHAEKVIGSIKTVLKEAGITLKDLDAVAVSIGPGSFTGLRIGLSTVKGLAFANNLPLVAVNTLDSLASNAMLWRGQICAVIHAQANEAYAALYRSNHFRQERIGDYELLDLNEIRDFIKEKTLLLHSGVKEIGRYLSAVDNGLITVAPEDACLLSGSTICRLGYERLKTGVTEAVETLEPYYLKEFKVKRKGGRST